MKALRGTQMRDDAVGISQDLFHSVWHNTKNKRVWNKQISEVWCGRKNNITVLQSNWITFELSHRPPRSGQCKKLFGSLRWRHNGLDSVSNHQPHDCLLKRLFRPRSKKISKLHVTGLCVGNSPETGEFPAQRANNAENVSIWWRHHVSWYLVIPCDIKYISAMRTDFIMFYWETTQEVPWSLGLYRSVIQSEFNFLHTIFVLINNSKFQPEGTEPYRDVRRCIYISKDDIIPDIIQKGW